MSAIRTFFGLSAEPARVGQAAALREAENRVNEAKTRLEATLREQREPLEQMINEIRTTPSPRKRAASKRRSAAR